jgi:hypothetical protein
MIDKISKCTMIFLAGMVTSLTAAAFFNQFMQMPQQAMMMGSTMMQGQDKPCNCQCPQRN